VSIFYGLAILPSFENANMPLGTMVKKVIDIKGFIVIYILITWSIRKGIERACNKKRVHQVTDPF
jgi:hypothetical protein